ncbi:MAG: hypothetical protein RIR11_2334 [Bacteroidota bacterium]|jgi:hypothetical protein
MKLSDLLQQLKTIDTLHFVQPNGQLVPPHFHITEVGLTTKHFIDCGSTVRTERVVNFQIWTAEDVDHRLKPKSLLSIIAQSAPILGQEDLEVEVEYQTETIGRYDLDMQDGQFLLKPKFTNCLAKDKCGIPAVKQQSGMFELVGADAGGSCTPGGGCC